jgi:hypothetical protein
MPRANFVTGSSKDLHWPASCGLNACPTRTPLWLPLPLPAPAAAPPSALALALRPPPPGPPLHSLTMARSCSGCALKRSYAESPPTPLSTTAVPPPMRMSFEIALLSATSCIPRRSQLRSRGKVDRRIPTLVCSTSLGGTARVNECECDGSWYGMDVRDVGGRPVAGTERRAGRARARLICDLEMLYVGSTSCARVAVRSKI